MSICKNCYKYDVCSFWANHDNPIEKLCDGCEFAEDANKIVELPCKFGDTIYMVFHFNIGNVDEVIEGNIEQVVIDKKIWFKAFFERSYWKSFNVEDIGKTVFLTREEAEKALKEMTEK